MHCIREAQFSDRPRLAEMFDAYRQFYDLPAEPECSSQYIDGRLLARDSVILVSSDEFGELSGFCQLYPSWCSLRMAAIYILSDLYVDPASRRCAIARTLLLAAAERARCDGRARMDLATAKSNLNAQALYESLGWERDDTFLTYSLMIG